MFGKGKDTVKAAKAHGGNYKASAAEKKAQEERERAAQEERQHQIGVNTERKNHQCDDFCPVPCPLKK